MRTKINALVVDDNKEFTSSIKEYFCSNAKIKIVSTISDGQEALDYIVKNQENIDVILMDIRMPVMTGYDAAKAIRAMDREDADLPIIAMTADAFSEDIQRCLACGMNAHISKPIDIKEVAKQLRRYIQ